MTAQERNINKDKKYVLLRGFSLMVHRTDGHRIYEGDDRSEAEALQKANEGAVLTDMTVPENRLTPAQKEIEKLKAAARRCNAPFLTVNKRSGKKLYMGADLKAARATLANDSCELIDMRAVAVS